MTPVYRKEFQRLKSAETAVKELSYGINKKQEITRLLYEISKRENILPQDILLKAEPCENYAGLKKYLLEKRFPEAVTCSETLNAYLPKLKFSSADVVHLRGGAQPLLVGGLGKINFSPRNIFVEKAVQDSSLAKRFKESFPCAKFEIIESLKIYLKGKKYTLRDYNRRRESVFITSQNYDFFKQCPCTIGARGCGYHVFNLGFGCPFECTYCFLQGYTNSPGIILPANLDKYFQEFSAYRSCIGGKGMRIGTGEFTDSLALDEWTGYSLPLIEFFRQHPEITFEFKTKSNVIGNLLKIRHAGNIVVSWSLNPQKIITENEFFTTSLAQRLTAAVKCVGAGYRVGFHFDPVIYFDGWEKEYTRVIELLFSRVKPRDVAWISIGSFRFSTSLKQVIERRFPGNKILDAELLLGYDNKLRYAGNLRFRMYMLILSKIREHSKKVFVYLCMEPQSLIASKFSGLL